MLPSQLANKYPPIFDNFATDQDGLPTNDIDEFCKLSPIGCIYRSSYSRNHRILFALLYVSRWSLLEVVPKKQIIKRMRLTEREVEKYEKVIDIKRLSNWPREMRKQIMSHPLLRKEYKNWKHNSTNAGFFRSYGSHKNKVSEIPDASKTL